MDIFQLFQFNPLYYRKFETVGEDSQEITDMLRNETGFLQTFLDDDIAVCTFKMIILQNKINEKIL